MQIIVHNFILAFYHNLVTGAAGKLSYDSNMASSHDYQSQLFCGVCGMNFKSNGSLERHLHFSV